MTSRCLALALLSALSTIIAAAQPFNPSLYAEMRWRMIGPFRGGRTVAIGGIPAQPNVYYMAPNDGGVWRSTDYGHVWTPLFDSQSTGSIGALAIAPSDPNTIYVGSGEGLQRPDLSVGNGIYKTTDAGKTWQHLGLRDGQQIASIIVDPHDANRLFIAVLGHPYGPNAERGVFRSSDGGASFTKVLYKDENTGAVDLAFDPKDPRIVYAVLWAARQAPWEIGASFNGPGSGLFKSIDGGDHWTQLTRDLPTVAEGLGRIGIGVAPSDPKRIYALVDAKAGGLYRSDDAGESWTRINTERRIWGRGGDFACVRVDPQNEDIIYVANTSTYRSTDAGRNFTAIKGAPGGDDYHTIWINPDNPRIIFLGSDQGATLSVNGGETWSSWYNQPTSQFYHVITDNRFPYWVYGGQQESGSVGIASRGDDGEITFRDWHPVGVEEYGYVAPDPLDPNLIYGGKATRYNQATGDVQNVSPAPVRGGKYRFVRTMPILFSPVDPHILYMAAQVLFKTMNGGQSWDVISPDLTRQSYPIPPNLGIFERDDPEKGKHRGVIYTVAPSPKDVNLIWIGTDDGLIQVTRDGGAHWSNITPPDLTPWSKVSILEASHYETNSAYAAINRFRLDDLHPYIYRTHDGGATWQKITAGIPEDEVVNAVREDPVRKGLLFAATEKVVYVSFDDGAQWQSLRLNMPAISVRDIVIHGDDLVAGTHGRSFWILDDITPLRQLTSEVASAEAFLVKPQLTYRVRRDRNTDTPLPPEVPAGQNAPDGAILDYYLRADATGPVTLEIVDRSGKTVRRCSSDDKPAPVDAKELTVPAYWVRPPRVLSAAPGMHRFIWDLRYPPPDALHHEYPISAIVHDTPREPQGPLVLAGDYTVKLTADGRSYTQPLRIVMDPRIKTPQSGLQQQFSLATRLVDDMRRDHEAVTKLGGKAKDDAVRLNGELASLYGIVEGCDDAPTTQAAAAAAELKKELDNILGSIH